VAHQFEEVGEDLIENKIAKIEKRSYLEVCAKRDYIELATFW
jgi:hypothetical protein